MTVLLSKVRFVTYKCATDSNLGCNTIVIFPCSVRFTLALLTITQHCIVLFMHTLAIFPHRVNFWVLGSGYLTIPLMHNYKVTNNDNNDVNYIPEDIRQRLTIYD